MTSVYIRLLQFILTETNESISGISTEGGDSRIICTIAQNDELIRGVVVVFRKVGLYCVGVESGGISLVVC
jgi:hypothetical protein